MALSPPLPRRLASPLVEVLAARAGCLGQAVRQRPWLVWPAVVVAYALLRPLVGLGHELAVLLLASGLHAAVATGWWQPLIGWLGLDPIYAGAAIRAAGGVQVSGLAVGGLLGARLHELWPGWFLAPGLVAPGAGVSMVAAMGAPALGHGLAAFGADVVCLTLGSGLVWHWRQRAGWLALLGLLIDGQIAMRHLLGTQVSVPDLEASGLPFAVAVALPSQGTWFTADLTRVPPATLNLAVGLVLLVLGLGCAALLLALPAAIRGLVSGLRGLLRRAPRLAGPVHLASARPPRRMLHAWRSLGAPGALGLGWPPARRVRRLSRRLVATSLGAALGLLTAVSPVGQVALGASNWQGVAGLSAATRLAPRGTPAFAAPITGPSVVSIERVGPAAWRYLVNGRPRVIRGVGYNPQYANLDPAERAQLYQRDFSAMRQLGINTVEGWFETQFDEVTLDAAAQNGIGVLMPFELNQDWPYENPNVQQSILDHVSAYVERYKDSPAVRMWAPGNEDLHRILYPNWVSKENDPTYRARADAFAAFLPVLVDRIHALDPNHPVIYRDAEDAYLGRLKAAFEQTGVERPWLVYGANVYAARRLQEIVNAWPSQWLPGPLVISEFAPGGVGPAERPLGFQLDWSTIRQRPDVVLGGLAYTWATNGPEQLDRVFGLVNPQGQPTDGALAALSSLYLADQATADQPGPT